MGRQKEQAELLCCQWRGRWKDAKFVRVLLVERQKEDSVLLARRQKEDAEFECYQWEGRRRVRILSLEAQNEEGEI